MDPSVESPGPEKLLPGQNVQAARAEGGPGPLEHALLLSADTGPETLWALLDQVPTPLAVAEAPSGRLVLCNAANRELWSLDSPVADTVEEHAKRCRGRRPDGRPYGPEEWPLSRAVRGERVEGEEIEVDLPDGRRRILRVNAVPVRDAAGRVTLAVATGHDVTETALRLARERFLGQASGIVSASLDHPGTVQRLAELCVESLAHYCLVHVEQGGEVRAIGVASSGPVPEAVVRERLPLLPVDPHGAHPVAEALRTGTSQLLPEVSAERLLGGPADGERLALLREAAVASVLVVPVRATGRTLGAITLARTPEAPPYGADDLALVEALAGRVAHAVDNARLYREAREAVRAREETMSVVSHDLRNSLHACLLNVDLLLDVVPVFGPETAPWRRMVAVRRALLHMHRLVQDLLEADRIGRGDLRLHAERLHPAWLVAEMEETLGPLAREAGVDLQVHLVDSPPAILADPARVVQVLGNLVGNALHATPRGGRVEVMVEPDSPGWVRLRVSDTGTGMEAGELQRVFDRFYQGTGARRTGIGLGLAIARGIVEAHGGRIWAESRPRQGSTFSFTLPAASG